MTRTSIRPLVLLFAASGIVLAQQPPVDPQAPPQSNPGWRRAADPAPAPPAQDQATPEQASQDQQAPPPVTTPDPPSRDAYGQVQQQPSGDRPPAAQPPRPYGLPAQVTLKPGTFISIRVNQMLASNKNAAGDTFSGALTQPMVVNGIVVAQRNQVVYGRVTEADKVKGMHRLGLELTGITLADGTAATIHSQLISRQGVIMPYGHQQDGVITTATADGSMPAAGAPTIGVLATKGHDSVIYPGTLLTFQTANQVTISTANSNGAFRYVSPDDYAQPSTMNTRVAARPAYGYGSGYPYPYPYYGYGYPYWGPVVGFGFGFGGFYGGGFRGGFRR